MYITPPRNQANRLNIAPLMKEMRGVEIHDIEGFIAWHPDPDMRQVARNARSHGGYVQPLINVQKRR
jgi:hypothetical protein